MPKALGSSVVIALAGKPRNRLAQPGAHRSPDLSNFVTNDLAQGGDVSAEINRAAARLIEISRHWANAIDSDVEAHLAAERAECAQEW